MAFTTLLATLLAGVVWLVGPGEISIDTRLADLVPAEVSGIDSALANGLVGDARDAASRVITLYLEADDPTALDAAVDAVTHEIDRIDGLSVQDPLTIASQLFQRLAPHRFSLLPEEDRLALQADDQAQLVDAAVSELVAPGMTPRPLEISEDPTNLMGRWMLSRLGGADKGTRTRPSIQIDAALDAGISNRDAVVQEWLDAVAAVTQAHADVEFLQTGAPLFAHEAAQRSRADINLISIGSLVGLAVLLLPVFRSPLPLLIPAISIAVGAATGFMLVALLQPSVHVLTLVFGASLIGIAIDYSIHGYVHLHAAQTRDKAASTLYRPLLLGLMTSAVGYGSLAFSGIPAMSSVALFSVGGLVGAWLTVVSLLPLSARFSSGVHGGWVERVATWLSRGGVALAQRKVWLSAALLACIAIAAFGTRTDDSPRRLITLSPALVADAQAIAERSTRQGRTELIVVTADSPQSVFESLDALDAALEVHAPDIDMSSVADWLPSPEQQGTNRTYSNALLADNGAVADVLTTIGAVPVLPLLSGLRDVRDADDQHPLDMAALFSDSELSLPPLMAADATHHAAIALPTGQGDSASLRAAAARVAGVHVLDAVVDADRALAKQRHATLRVLVLGLVGIGILLLLAYRNVRALGLLCVPVGAMLGTVTVLACLGVPLTLFHAVGLFLVLGLGMDYVIFLRELDHEAPATTRLAVVLSAATSLVSFGLLAASSIPVARFFGQTVFIGNTLNLILSFVMVALLHNGRSLSVEPAHG